jgi:hypothetical protein
LHSFVGFFALVLAFTATQLIVGCGGSGGSGSGNGSGGGGNNNSTPVITSLNPVKVSAGASAITLTVSGSGFVSTSTVSVGGSAEATTYSSATQLTATVPTTQLTSGGNLAVVVSNGSVTSTPASLEVDNPAPAISSLTPSTQLVGATSPVVTLTGTGFVPTTIVNVNGSARSTSYISATQVNVTLNSSDVTAAGSLALTAVNSTPGGGSSTDMNLPVNNPSLGPIQLNPSQLPAGATSPATITVTGNTFVAASVVNVNSVARNTTYGNPTTLTFVATVADQATQGTFTVTVTNPTPGGGTSPSASLTVAPPSQTPVITTVTPNSFLAGSPDSSITVNGTGFTQSSVVQWNGIALNTTYFYYYSPYLYAVVPAADLATAGSANITVITPTATPSTSNAVAVAITNPPAPTLTSIYPSGGSVNTATSITLNGTGFTAQTTVALNGVAIPSTYNNSTALTSTIPASSVALPGNYNITVSTPAPGGGTSGAQLYTTFISIANNDIVYNAKDGLLYASVPAIALGSGGNSVVGIDPVTGNIMRTIWVGSRPNKLALSSDGTQIFVGLDGAAAVAQVNLTNGTVVNQFPLGGGPGIYNPPFTAQYLAAVPGSPNSVAVTSQSSPYGGFGVTIYDSGVARTNGYTSGAGPLSFGSSSSVLYTATGSSIVQLTVDATGIASSTTLATTTGVYANTSNLQYDNGRLYLSSGQVFDAGTGTLLGTFFSSTTAAATGPVVSDSTLGRAFIAATNFSSSAQVLAFDESTFNSAASISVNALGTQGYPTSFSKIVRWGQNGLALSANASAFTSLNQIYIFQTPLVADLTSTPADLGVTLTAPSTAATGTTASWVAKITNHGPNQATGAALAMSLDSTLIINSITATQGSCGSGSAFTCDLGTLANGASVTVTVSATPTTAATIAGTANVSSTTVDPTTTNNQATSSTTVSGNFYAAMPVLSGIAPNFVQAGSSDFTLTVTGAGFSQGSTVNLGSTALATAFVSATELTATVPAANIANYGWAPVTVTNLSPGGGASQVVPLTIYSMVNLQANGLLFDPYSQLLYATIPGTAVGITGNSVVTLDPVTGTSGTPVLVGSNPTVMAETSDGNYLYIGLAGANSLAQFDLQQDSLKTTIPLSLTQFGSTSPVLATWLTAMPGTDSTVALGMNNSWGNFGIFDISGSTGSFRTNLSGIYSGVNPVFADPTHVYAYDSQTSGAEFYRYSVDSNGLTLIDGTTLNGIGGFSGSFQLAGGLVYGAGGGIINPKTTPPSQIAALPLLDFYQSGSNGVGAGIVPDPSLKKEFLMLENLAGTSAYGLTRYDLTTYLPEAILSMPQSLTGVSSNWTMLRWGQDGLALLVSIPNYATNQNVTTVILLRGPFVTPQELNTTGTAAALTSSSSSTLAHGSGNTMLTLTGSNFQPGVAVTWNGNYRTTTIVDASHVTIAIPASDIANTGTASLVATNPGANASNTLQITVH